MIPFDPLPARSQVGAPARIVIADAQLLFRQGLAALLRERSGWEVVGEAGDGAEVVRIVGALRPDILVLDVQLPPTGGIAVTSEIRKVSPGTRIVALTPYTDGHFITRVRQAGAAACMPKDGAFEHLADAVTAVTGESVASRRLASCPRSPPATSQSDRYKLSAREREVLALMADGLRTAEVAELLGISPKTVETYRTRLMNKLGIDNLAGLVRYALRAELVSLGA